MIRLKSLLTEGVAPEITPKFIELIKNWENNKDYKPGGWNKTKQRWFPHRSPEGGTPTIAYGHKLTSKDVASGKFQNGIADAEALKLLESDLMIARGKAIDLVSSYSKLPGNTQRALINACYRGELSRKGTPNTLNLMNAGKWIEAAEEYLNHAEYKSGGAELRKRMKWNYDQFKATATSNTVTAKTTTNKQTNDDWITQITSPLDMDALLKSYEEPSQRTSTTSSGKIYHVVKSKETLSGIASKYKTSVANLKTLNTLSSDMIKPGQKLRIK